MFYVYFIFSGLLVYMSFRSFRGGLDYLRYFRQELTPGAGAFAPFATVVVPCKGIDEGLADNLTAILTQKYPAFEVIFVIDSENEPALDVIKSVIGSGSETPTKTVIAPRSVNSAQKVENLREAVLHAAEESEVFVFVDSDTRPRNDWLLHLIAPLKDRSVGAATGYRWFISKHGDFASEMLSVWNASIASALGPDRNRNFCWGGSTAIRRETFERIGMRDRWIGTLSDDFAVTRAVSEAGLSICFVPQALTASIGNCSLRGLFEFTNRQMKITRVYMPHLWLLSFFGSVVFNAVLIASVLIVILSRQNDLCVLFALAVITLVSIFSIGKSWLRLKAVELVLDKQWPSVKRQTFAQNTLWLLSPALFLTNCISALFSRRVTWRGISYELKSPGETVIIADQSR
jgi:ceramide glucosyltransferase